MNFETRIFAHICQLSLTSFLFFNYKKEISYPNILSRSRPDDATWSRSFPLIVARAANDGYLEVDIDFETKAKQVASYRVDDLL